MSLQGHNISCGGRFEYLHRSPASRRRRRKGNPVPGGKTGPPCCCGIKIRGPGFVGWGSLEFETVKYGHGSRGTRTREWLRWRGPAAILSSQRMSHKDRRQLILVINLFDSLMKIICIKVRLLHDKIWMKRVAKNTQLEVERHYVWTNGLSPHHAFTVYSECRERNIETVASTWDYTKKVRASMTQSVLRLVYELNSRRIGIRILSGIQYLFFSTLFKMWS
jgi:hypothetical protein